MAGRAPAPGIEAILRRKSSSMIRYDRSELEEELDEPKTSQIREDDTRPDLLVLC
jgi:hypothetical protein